MNYLYLHTDIDILFRHLTSHQIYLYILNALKKEGYNDLYTKGMRLIYWDNKKYSKIKIDDANIVKKVVELKIQSRVIKEEFKNKQGFTNYRIKIETIEKMLSEILTYNELMIFFYIERWYNRNQFNRVYKLQIIDLLDGIFNQSNSRQYKKLLLSSLDRFKEWKYKDKTVFIKNYTIEKKIIQIELDRCRKTKKI